MSIHKVRDKDKFLVIPTSFRGTLIKINKGSNEKIYSQDLDYITNIPIDFAWKAEGIYTREELEKKLSSMAEDADNSIKKLASAFTKVSLYKEKNNKTKL